MMLSQWLAEHPKAYMSPISPWWAVYSNGVDITGLYHLTDFRVSSVDGGFLYWLVPTA